MRRKKVGNVYHVCWTSFWVIFSTQTEHFLQRMFFRHDGIERRAREGKQNKLFYLLMSRASDEPKLILNKFHTFFFISFLREKKREKFLTQ